MIKSAATCCGLLALVVTSACSSASGGDDGKSASSSSAIIGGSDGSATHPEIGTIVSQRSGGTSGTCTLELLAPTLAVTAAHCLADVSFTNNSQGAGTVCGTLGVYYDKSTIVVTIGGQTRGVSQIINDGQLTTCDGDLVFLELDTPVANVTFPELELDTIPAENGKVTACGFGFTSTVCAAPTTVQCVDGSVLISNGGYYAADFDQFPQGDMVSTNATCFLDDGGGVYNDDTGALVAIRGLAFNPNKANIDTISEPCKSCDGAVTQSTLLSQYPAFVSRAFATVGLAPPRHGHPAPQPIGGTCVEALDCDSQICVGVGTTGYCSEYCDSTACPSGTTCESVETEKVCLPTVTPDPASCSTNGAGDTRSSGATGWLYGVGLAYVVSRRRRKSGRAKGANR